MNTQWLLLAGLLLASTASTSFAMVPQQVKGSVQFKGKVGRTAFTYSADEAIALITDGKNNTLTDFWRLMAHRDDVPMLESILAQLEGNAAKPRFIATVNFYLVALMDKQIPEGLITKILELYPELADNNIQQIAPRSLTAAIQAEKIRHGSNLQSQASIDAAAKIERLELVVKAAQDAAPRRASGPTAGEADDWRSLDD